MFVTKIKMAVLVLFVVGLLATGGMLTRHALNAAPEPEVQKEAPPEAARKIEDKKKTVRVVHPAPGGLERLSRYAGHVRASAQQQVYAAVSGYLEQQRVDIGSRVRKGEVLAVIDMSLLRVQVKEAQAAVALAQGKAQEAKAHVTTAEAELKAAGNRVKAAQAKLKTDMAYVKFRQAQLKRYQELLANRSIDQRTVDQQQDHFEAAQEAVNASNEAVTSAQAGVAVMESKIGSAKAAWETAQTHVKMAELALEKAQIQLDLAVVRASFDGVVTRRNFDVGDYISANEQGARRPLMTVQRIDPVRIVVLIAESEVPLTRPGISVDLSSAALPDVKLSAGKVSRIGYSIDETTGTMPAEIDVPNPKGLLRPGMVMSVKLHLEEAPANAFRIPQSSLVIGEKGEPFVYIIRDGEARRTPIRVGKESEGEVEVLSGVRAADRIVVNPKGLSGDVVPVEIEKGP